MVETKSVGVHYKTSFNQILRLPIKLWGVSPPACTVSLLHAVRQSVNTFSAWGEVHRW